MDSIYDKPRRAPIAVRTSTPSISWVVPSASINEDYFEKNQINKKLCFGATPNAMKQAELVSFTRKLVRFKIPNSNGLELYSENKRDLSKTRNIQLCNNTTSNENVYKVNVPNKNLDLSNIGLLKIIDTSEDSKMIPNKVQKHLPLETKLCSQGEPTVNDLLKIIQHQNEKLTSLQTQVNNLINCNQRHNSIEPVKGKTKLRNIELSITSKKTRNEITSNFECNAANGGLQLQNMEQNISEIRKNMDVSLMLNESVKILKHYESPDTSIHVDMEDYSSDDDNEHPSSIIGWTIYNNVMKQVTHLLNKSNKKKILEKPNSQKKICKKTFKIVTEETIRQLKNMGATLPINNENIPTSTKDIQYSPREVSIAVKQLIIKYLPEVNMAKIRNNKESNTKCYDVKQIPEISLATIQYMKKYNLLENDSIIDSEAST